MGFMLSLLIGTAQTQAAGLREEVVQFGAFGDIHIYRTTTCQKTWSCSSPVTAITISAGITNDLLK